jgi:rRNA small subunit pseudouridine methyltransferase Nep1
LLSFVLAESALELVPREIRSHPALVSDARRRQKDALEILLDRSFHHSAMLKLKDSEKRGRPDLVHVTLLSVTGTPLYLDGRMRVFVHTHDDVVLEIEEKTRIPKNYLRFRGLMEEALVERPKQGLVRAHSMNIKELIGKASPDSVFGLSVQGKMTSLEELAKAISAANNPYLVVGGFPRGHFSPATLSVVDQLVRIDARPLEAQVVASRVVYEVEKAMTGSTIKSGG